MPNLAGFGQGFSNAINANSQNNQQDAQTKIIQLHQEAMRRSQAGDVWGARALKLMADQIGGTAGFGGPPMPPAGMPQPPMPGTQSMPAPQAPPPPPMAAAGPVTQPLAAPPPMQGVPLPPYKPLNSVSDATRDANGFYGGIEDVGPVTVGPDGNPSVAVNAPVMNVTDANDQPGGVPPPPPAASPVAGAAAPGTPGAPVSPPGPGAQLGAQAPMQMGPNGLPQGPQLAGNLNALNAIKALKSIGAPDEVIMDALKHMEPIFAVEYKATIAAQHAALNAYKAEMQGAYQQGRLEQSDLNRASRDKNEAAKLEQKDRSLAARVEKAAQASKDYQARTAIMQARVERMPNANSAEAQAFRYAKQLSDKAHADLHSFVTALSKTTDETQKEALNNQIGEAMAAADAYDKSMTAAYNRLNLGEGISNKGTNPKAEGVPLPPKTEGAKGTNGWKIERVQ